jgi:hypothetical protein
MSRVLNAVLSVLLACSLFAQSDQRAKADRMRTNLELKLNSLVTGQPIQMARRPASVAPPVDQVAFAFAIRECEFHGSCGAAKAIAARRGLFDVAIQLARIECERTGEPCFDAGVFSRMAGYSEETVFWNVVAFCRTSIGGMSCRRLKSVGYDEEAFLDFLEIKISKRDRKGRVSSKKVGDVLYPVL